MENAGISEGTPRRSMIKTLKDAAWPFYWQFATRYYRADSALYDFINKTDTSGRIAARDLDISGDMVGHVTSFESVSEPHLRQVLSAFDFPQESVFVDIGCGKAKPQLVAARFDFIKEVVGVELSPALCAIAEANMEIARKRGTLTKPSTIIEADATVVELQPSWNIIFINNPFDKEFMMRMVDILHRHAVKQSRDTWVLYGNPQHKQAVVEDGRLKFVRRFKSFGPNRIIDVFKF